MVLAHVHGELRLLLHSSAASDVCTRLEASSQTNLSFACVSAAPGPADRPRGCRPRPRAPLTTCWPTAVCCTLGSCLLQVTTQTFTQHTNSHDSAGETAQNTKREATKVSLFLLDSFTNRFSRFSFSFSHVSADFQTCLRRVSAMFQLSFSHVSATVCY